MTEHIFRQILPFIIVTFFFGTSLASTIQQEPSSSIQLPMTDNSSLQEHAMEKIPKTSYTLGESSIVQKEIPKLPFCTTIKNDKNKLHDRTMGPTSQGHIAYAWCVYDPGGQIPEGLVYFYLDDPSTIYSVGPGGGILLSSADFLNEHIMYGGDYAGGLYMIDVDTVECIYISPTIAIKGLTYDSTTNIWYATSSNSLYTLDVNTGVTTLLGSHGIPNSIFGIACDTNGNIYGYDVVWTGDSTLYSINKTTGFATAIGSMGYGFVYSQDCGYDRDNHILYIAGYFNDGTPSALLTCDVTTGACNIVGNFPGGVELDGLGIPWSPYHYDHDIEIKQIIHPANGNAQPVTPSINMENTGNSTEMNVDVRLQIGKELITESVEDFEADNGSYLHEPITSQVDAWTWGTPTAGPDTAHSGSHVWATNLAGNYPPNMWCSLVTPEFTVPSGALFNFWHWYYFENNYDGGNVKISNDNGTTWTLITPVGGYPGTLPYNPYMTGQPAYNGQSSGWKQATFDLSTYEAQDCMIMFETASDPSVQYTGWYIDDVGFTITNWENEYNQTMTIPVINPDETLEVTFPEWTPSDLGTVENAAIHYNAEATNLFADNNTNNDYKNKLFNLYYGYFHDVAITDIVSPHSGPAIPQTPEIVIKNNGQNAENATVTMTIGKALYTTLLEEDFSSGVPPAGWGTTHPSNWISSSTNSAGGVAPEAEFSWTPSNVGEHLLYTDIIDTTGYTTLLLQFKEYVNDYNSDYTLKIVTSTDGGATWNEAWSRPGGPFGPTTTEVALTAADGVGSATLQIAWDMSGDSFNINYWYIDDVFMGIIDMVEEYNETMMVDIDAGVSLNIVFPEWTPADIPGLAEDIDYLITANSSINSSDENPIDNENEELITVHYEHDVGVVVITEYPGAPSSRDIIWDNYGDDGTGIGLSSQLDTQYPFNSQCADDFQFALKLDVDQVHWWGQFYNGDVYPNPCEFNIIFYADDGGIPTGAGMDDPTPTALAVYNFPAVTGVAYDENAYEYDVILTPAFVADGGVNYWIAIQAVCVFSTDGQWGWSTNGANPDQLSLPYQGFPLPGGVPYWTATGYGDQAFQLSAYAGGGNPPPGTYQIAGYIENLGVTYPESDIPVNAQVTNDTDVVVYDETVIVPGPIVPGQMAEVIFPDIVIPDTPLAEGDYILTMQTQLSDDDHPDNDKRIQTWVIQRPDVTPPITQATIAGTIGDNDWYISDITVTLTAYDPDSNSRWPSGVNHTYYKIDDGSWMEYEVPFVIEGDGEHTVCYYSTDNAGNTEDVKCFTFKIDQTPPVITDFTVTAQNALKNKWLLAVIAEDETSGIVLIEFYADNALVGSVTTSPFEFLVDQKIHTAQCIVYDAAGNNQMSDVVIAFEFEYQQNIYIQQKQNSRQLDN